MYERFYHLTAEPFRLSPDPRFAYEHPSYTRARKYMLYALRRAEGFIMVTGRPGTGKTTLVEDLLASAPSSRLVAAKLVSAQFQAEELLRKVAYSFGVEARGLDKATLLYRLEEFLVEQSEQGRAILLVIDEAQGLASAALEELRLLTNIMQDSRPLLQVFLVGQEELRRIVQAPEMEQFQQRLIAACHLRPLEPVETRSYIEHRLRRAGWAGDPTFSGDALVLIHQFSQGVPRRINQLCSRVLLHGAAEERHAVTGRDVMTVIGELRDEVLAPADLPEELALGAMFPDDSELESPSLVPEGLSHVEPRPSAGPAPRAPSGPEGSGLEVVPEEPQSGPAARPAGATLDGLTEPRPGPGPLLRPESVEPPDLAREGAGARVEPEAERPVRPRPPFPEPVLPTRWTRGAKVLAAFLVVLAVLAGAFAVRPGLVIDLKRLVSGGGGGARSSLAERPPGGAEAPAAERVAGARPSTPPSPGQGGAAGSGPSASAGRGPAPVVLDEPGARGASAPSSTSELRPAPLPTPRDVLAGAADGPPGSAPAPTVSLPSGPPGPPPVETTRRVPADPVPSPPPTLPPPPSQEAPRAPAEEGALSGLAQELSSLGVVSERLADGRVKVNLRDQVAFDLNSVELRGGSRSFLDRVAAALVARPNVLAQVVGYTDPTGSPERNLALSRRRAEAVSTYLASRGVAGSRLLVEGRGSQPDPSTNVPSTEIWRLRRIELYLTEAPDQPAP